MTALDHIFICYLLSLLYSAYTSKFKKIPVTPSRFPLKYLIIPGKALIAQGVLQWRQMPHSVLWSSPLITLEFSLLIILSEDLSICPPCSIFNLNLFSNINKFSIFGYLCDIFFNETWKKSRNQLCLFLKIHIQREMSGWKKLQKLCC